jgi:hypothetical protein
MASGYTRIEYKDTDTKKTTTPPKAKVKTGKGNKKSIGSPHDGSTCDHRSQYAK